MSREHTCIVCGTKWTADSPVCPVDHQSLIPLLRMQIRDLRQDKDRQQQVIDRLTSFLDRIAAHTIGPHHWSVGYIHEFAADAVYLLSLRPATVPRFQMSDRVVVVRVLDDITSPELVGMHGEVVEVETVSRTQHNYSVRLDATGQWHYLNEQMLELEVAASASGAYTGG